MKIDDVVENRTICDVFGVSYMGDSRQQFSQPDRPYL